ncbi:16S rRNA (guanine(966)-N(2))-methyltransferase RsmD [Marinicella litoralis]|uniref:Ribosomal RNA small subunit methyltransferase D n=1 Tax=Marinicella litoralis TaxID=644220 RepID=A0A4R6XT75_9GAMM|nr:16S rRNA (guanine(966)-N(2))-methyltransferase RsmD [Marinicella litoralis]TDR23152.1 16S rRNA (guanine(966)-N(2))-methyltransferase RsmD [Marinicella litoralis]
MGQIRITGGIHRSRKITVEDQPGLRPTPDRIRETLFNWLGQNLSGLQVLDLYAGSGILAFEAASRGAEKVVCVDNNLQTIKQLHANLNQLKLEQIIIKQQNAAQFIAHCDQTFDLVFLDPPFDSNEMNTISGIISPLVRTAGKIYREYGITQDIAPMDEQFWNIIQQKKAGQVQFEIWQKL